MLLFVPVPGTCRTDKLARFPVNQVAFSPASQPPNLYTANQRVFHKNSRSVTANDRNSFIIWNWQVSNLRIPAAGRENGSRYPGGQSPFFDFSTFPKLTASEEGNEVTRTALLLPLFSGVLGSYIGRINKKKPLFPAAQYRFKKNRYKHWKQAALMSK